MTMKCAFIGTVHGIDIEAIVHGKRMKSNVLACASI